VLQIIQLVKLRRERRRRALNVDEDGNEIFDEEADSQPCAKATLPALGLPFSSTGPWVSALKLLFRTTSFTDPDAVLQA